MPALPTVTVTDAQMARLLNVFKDGPGYRAWLVQQLKAAVINYELAQLQEQQRVELETARLEITASLDGTT